MLVIAIQLDHRHRDASAGVAKPHSRTFIEDHGEAERGNAYRHEKTYWACNVANTNLDPLLSIVC